MVWHITSNQDKRVDTVLSAKAVTFLNAKLISRLIEVLFLLAMELVGYQCPFMFLCLVCVCVSVFLSVRGSILCENEFWFLFHNNLCVYFFPLKLCTEFDTWGGGGGGIKALEETEVFCLSRAPVNCCRFNTLLMPFVWVRPWEDTFFWFEGGNFVSCACQSGGCFSKSKGAYWRKCVTVSRCGPLKHNGWLLIKNEML